MTTRTHRLLIASAVLALSLGFAGCTGSAVDDAGTSASGGAGQAENQKPTPTPTPVSLDGKWKQSNSKSADSWQAAVITGDTIEINWVTDNGGTTALYWAGSVAPTPADGSETFTWTSNNDTSKTENAMMASSDPTKEFTYDHGVISYKASALGVTVTVTLAPEK